MASMGGGVTVIVTAQDDTGKVLDQIAERMDRAAAAAAAAGAKIGEGFAKGRAEVEGLNIAMLKAQQAAATLRSEESDAVSRRAKELADLRRAIEARYSDGSSAGSTRAGQLASDMEKLGHEVPQVAAASAAIRTFEGSIPIRAVERFLTMIPGVGKALQVAFPVIGLVVMGELIFETIGKLRELVKEAEEANHKAEQAFQSAAGSIRGEADSLAVANDRLEEQIAKLEKKPGNGLKAALDEAREAADKLDSSLQADVKTMEALLKENKVTFFQRLTGQASTDKDAADITSINNAISSQSRTNRERFDAYHSSNQEEYDRQKASGASAKDLLELQKRQQRDEQVVTEQGLAALQEIYKRADPLKQRLRDLQQLNNDKAYQGFGGEDNGRRIAMLGGALDIFDEQQRRTGEEFYGGQKKGEKDEAQAKHDADELAKQGAEAQRKIVESRERLAEAQKKLAQASADEQLRVTKAGADAAQALLDADHKDGLLSDEEYFRQRGAIQEAAIQKEIALQKSKQSAIDSQLGTLRGESPKGQAERNTRDAKVNDLLAERLKIAGQIAGLEEQIGKSQLQTIEAVGDLERERLKSSDAVAARLEALQGGAVSARNKQASDDFYGDGGAQDQMFAKGATEADIKNAEDALKLENAGRDAQQAERDAARGTASVAAARQRVGFDERSGSISTVEARRRRQGLDAGEADQLQTVQDAYQKLADAGDLNATAKVEELKEKIFELRNPINESAEALRSGFDNAFESLFENLSEGTKGFENFARDIQRTLTRAVYKEAIEPVIQQGIGSIFPNSKRTGGVLPSGVDMGAITRGIFPSGIKVPGVGGTVPDALGGGKGKVSILINLQQNDQGKFDLASVLKQGDDSDSFEAKIANSFNTGGIMRQLLMGAGG